jgi:tellurite resistance protein TehA-like permease
MLAAEPWTYWIGLVLFIVGVILFVALLIGYLVKVERMKHPSRRQREQLQQLER